MDNTPDTDHEAAADKLRAQMVERLKAAGRIRTPRVEAAMRTVRRHTYVPDATLEDAYADKAVTIKPGLPGGQPLSCASDPVIVAEMLEMLNVQPGDKVWEIAAGTGYNAALLAELAGPGGSVVTQDIDPDVTAHARRALDATGFERVEVITGDGATISPTGGPFDKVIVTVGAWDMNPAWWQQLANGGHLVLPLRWRGTTRAIAFTKKGSTLVSDSSTLCGFVPMVGQDGERDAAIAPDGSVKVYWDQDQHIDPHQLTAALQQPKHEARSGVLIGPQDSTDGIWVRASATHPGTCRIQALPAAVESGLATPAFPSRSPAIVVGDSIAYLGLRRLEDEPLWELAAFGNGPDADKLTATLVDIIRAWNDDRDSEPAITVYHADDSTGNDAPIVKPNIRFNVTMTPAKG